MDIPNDWIVEVAWVLIPIIVGYVARIVAPAVRRFYESKVSVEHQHVLAELARVAVLAAEAAYGSQSGQAKMAYAKQVMNDSLRARNIPTTVDEIYAHIEAAVHNEFNGPYGAHAEAKKAESASTGKCENCSSIAGEEVKR